MEASQPEEDNAGADARGVGLGLFSIVALGANTIVGSGIFRLPSELARDLGVASPLAFVVCALLLAPVVLSFAEAGSMFDRGGGPYLYTRVALGDTVGSGIGLSLFVSTVLTLAATAAAVPGQLAELYAPVGQPVAAAALAAGVVVFFGALHLLGLRSATAATNLLVVVKVAPLVVFCAVGAFFVPRGPASASPAPTGGLALTAPLLVGFYALSGFETSTIPAGDARAPKRHVPVAVLLSVFGAAALYAVVQLVAVGVLGAGELAASDRPLADASRVFFGEPGAKGMALLGALSLLGLCAAMATAGPFLLEALAADGLAPSILCTRRRRDDAPISGVVLTTVPAAVLVVAKDFRSLVDLTSLVLVGQYAVVCVSVAVLRHRWRDAPRDFRIPLGPAIPIAGALAQIWVASQLSLRELLVGAAVLGAGAPIPWLRRRFTGGTR